jgi:hypothetical protein
VFLLCKLTSGAFTIDFSRPTLRINLKGYPIFRDLLNRLASDLVYQN